MTLTHTQVAELRRTIEVRHTALLAEVHADVARARDESYGEVAGPVTDPADRRKRLLEAAEKNRSSPVLPMMIGQTYDEEGRTDEAIRAYQQALELRPTCAPCHEALGKLLIRKKKTEEGNIHILKSQLFNPNGNELKSSGD